MAIAWNMGLLVRSRHDCGPIIEEYIKDNEDFFFEIMKTAR